MTFFHIPESFVERVGWLLIHSLWQISLVALLTELACQILRNATSRTRYRVLISLFLGCALLPLTTWPFTHTEVTSPVEEVTPVASPAELISEVATLPKSQRPPVAEEVVAIVPPSVSPSPPVVEQAVREAVTSPIRTDLTSWLPTIVACWFCGVLLSATRPLTSLYTIHRLRSVGVSAVPEAVQDLVQQVSQKLRMSQSVRVLQSTLVRVPAIVGYFRPIVLLPVSLLSGLPVPQLEAILAHELAHVWRHDYLFNLLQTVVETIFFYHPAVWWMSHRIRCERECCCDDLAVEVVGNAAVYGRALLAIEVLRGTTPAIVLGAHGGSLMARIRRMAQTPANRQEVRSSNITAGMVIVCVALGIVLALPLQQRWSRVQAESPAANPVEARTEVKKQDLNNTAQGSQVDVAKTPLPTPHRQRAVASDASRDDFNGENATHPKRVPLEFRIVAPRRDEASSKEIGTTWLPILKASNSKGPMSSGLDLPSERKVEENWEGLLLDTPEHFLKWDDTWRVVKCEVEQDPSNSKHFSINVTLDAAGGTAFRGLTETHLNQRLAIVVEGKIITAPVIRSSIGQQIAITGAFSREEALKLATSIRRATYHSFDCEIVDAVTGKPIAGNDLTIQFLFMQPTNKVAPDKVIDNVVWGPKSGSKFSFIVPDRTLEQADLEHVVLHLGVQHPEYETLAGKELIPLGQIFRDDPKSAREQIRRIALQPKPAAGTKPLPAATKDMAVAEDPNAFSQVIVKYDIAGSEESCKIFVQHIGSPDVIGTDGSEFLKWTPLKNGNTLNLKDLESGDYQVARYRQIDAAKAGMGRMQIGTFLDRRQFKLEVGKPVHIDYTRPQGRPLTGKIYGLKEKNLEHAVVYVCSANAFTPSFLRELDINTFDARTCHPDGSFQTEPLMPGVYYVHVQAYQPLTGFEPGIVQPQFVGFERVVITADKAHVPLEINLLDTKDPTDQFRLKCLTSIRLSVLDSTGKKGIPKFKVIPGHRVGNDDNNQPEWDLKAARDGKDGDFTWPLEELDGRDWAFKIEADGLEPRYWTWIKQADGIQHIIFMMVEKPAPKK